MPDPKAARSSFDYAIVQVVPRVERGERMNAGVIVYCRAQDFLQAKIELDRDRLRALDPTADADAIAESLGVIAAVCRGEGPVGALQPKERFDWLVAPRSTIVQTSPVHSGLCDDPAAALDHLLVTMVQRP